jgi:hypothetical protein
MSSGAQLAEMIAGIALAIGMVAAYFAPSIVANRRAHHQGGAILTLNLLLGWTMIGWIVAMIWAMTATRQPA